MSWREPTKILIGAERSIFTFIGLIFFVAALVLAVRALQSLYHMAAGPEAALIDNGTRFLDLMLLVLMIVELAFTVIITLRGSQLTAEPFLLVGLIAVIRRMLVITISDVSPQGSPHFAESVAASGAELGILTGVIVVLVLSIFLLRRDAAKALNGAEQWPES